MDPFKFPPRDQSLYVLGKILSWWMLPGTLGSIGTKSIHLVEAYVAYPGNARPLGRNWKSQILNGVFFGPSFQKAMLFS